MELHLLTFVALASLLGCCSERLKTVPDLAEEFGYYWEEHKLVTQDGYFLTGYRMLSERPVTYPVNKPVVILLPTLFTTGVGFLLFGRERGVGFALADAGYDVWLADLRGSPSSNQHMRFHNQSRQYWNFTHTELGLYDVPAHVDKAMQVTGQRSMQALGFSLGTTVALICLAERPEYNGVISHVYMWSPSVYYQYLSPFVTFVSHFARIIDNVMQETNHGIMPINNSVFETVCTNRKVWNLCIEVMARTLGPNTKRFNESEFPIFIPYLTSVASKIFLHYSQGVGKSKWFRYFDYGERNKIAYGTRTPPSFNLRRVTTPISMYNGNGDWIILSKNLEILAKELPNVRRRITLDDDFNHADFFLGVDVREKAIEPLLRHMAADRNAL